VYIIVVAIADPPRGHPDATPFNCSFTREQFELLFTKLQSNETKVSTFVCFVSTEQFAVVTDIAKARAIPYDIVCWQKMGTLRNGVCSVIHRSNHSMYSKRVQCL
jgi:hypothetical protein